MAEITEDFIRFLKANFPDDFRKITSRSVKEDVINSIWSRREEDYKIWRRIPEWIKNQYRDDLPDEVFNGSKSVKEFMKEEEEKILLKEKEDKELINYGVSLLAVGYAIENVNALVKNREERNRIIREANGEKLTQEQLGRILDLRLSDKAIKVRDWKENQREKYFMHLVRELSRIKKREELAKSSAVKAGLEMKEANLRRELKAVSGELDNEEFRKLLQNHLSLDTERACLKHLHKGVFDDVCGCLGKYGIDLEAMRNCEYHKFMYDKLNLAKELKQQYAKRSEKSIATNELKGLEKIKKEVKDRVSPKLNMRLAYFRGRE